MLPPGLQGCADKPPACVSYTARVAAGLTGKEGASCSLGSRQHALAPRGRIPSHCASASPPGSEIQISNISGIAPRLGLVP